MNHKRSEASPINASLTNWENAVLGCIKSFGAKVFVTDDVYKFEQELQKRFPDNHTVRDTTRRVLQQLRDKGYLDFVAHGKYRLSNGKDSDSSPIRSGEGTFVWTEFYEAIADSLLEHQGDRGPLIAAIHELVNRVGGLNYLTDTYADGTRGPIRDICPFTTLGLFNRYITDANRKMIARELAEFLHVQVPVPDTFHGVPLNDNRNSWFFGYEKNRGANDIGTLWEVFRLALTQDAESLESEQFMAAYDQALAVRGVNWNLTMGLFWARPWMFPTLDGNSRQYINETLSVALGGHSARAFLQLRKDLLSVFDRHDSPVHSFPELSLAAWSGKQDKFKVSTKIVSELNSHPMADDVAKLLDHSRTHAVLLYGPAGTGKTYAASHIADAYGGANGDRIAHVQFHPAYAYEDFVEGLRPERGNGGLITYDNKDGVFTEFCTRARKNPNEKHLFIIDEINRGNIAKVMGELMYALEYRGREITLPYSRARFSIPENVHILGTMNSSDRSIATLDVALRRRFQFVELAPDSTLLVNVDSDELGLADGIGGLLDALNRAILKRQGRHKLLGHSYFMPPDFEDVENAGTWTVQGFKARWFHQILPLLEEYFVDDLRALRDVIGPGWEGESSPKDGDHFVPVRPESLDEDEDFTALLKKMTEHLASKA